MSVLLLAALASANPNGKAGVAATGCTCHGNAAASVSVELGAEATEVEVGEEVPVWLTVEHADGVAAGLDVHADGGAFAAGVDTQVKSGDITHLEPTPLSAGAHTFAFTWRADVDGTYTLRAAGMATDGNERDQGDWWNFADDVTVVVGTGVSPDTGDTADPGDTADTGGEPPPCGCASGGAGLAGSAGLGLAALAARRRAPRAAG